MDFLCVQFHSTIKHSLIIQNNRLIGKRVL